MLLAVRDGQFLGHAGFTGYDAGIAEVQKVWTDTAARGCGVAGLLMGELRHAMVAAGYGATLLPHEAPSAAPLDPRIRMLPLQRPLWRPLGIAHREGGVERATQHVLDVLWQQKQG